MTTFLLLHPGEFAGASNCEYWDKSIVLGQRTHQTRVAAYEIVIVKALWPSQLGGKFESPGLPSFDDFEVGYVLPQYSRAECDVGASDASSPIAFQLALNQMRTEHPNQVWSVIHFLMHHQPNPMGSTRVAASRTMAVFLAHNFWCTNCRGYFTTGGILEAFGLPPQSTAPVDHAKYWNFGHNIASEHVATTRGADPWIYQLGEENVKEF